MDGIALLSVEDAATHAAVLTEEFLRFLHLEKHASPCTVRSYRADLYQFGLFLSGAIGLWNRDRRTFDKNLDQKFLACTPLTARDFVSYLFAQNYCNASIARKMAALKGFYKFLTRRAMLSDNPLLTLRPPTQEKRVPKYLDQEQVHKLLIAPGGSGDVLSVRDSAILEMLCSTGIRASEMVELKLPDLDLLAGTVHVRGLAPVNRAVPISLRAILALERYLPMRATQGKPGQQLGDWVFLNKHGGSLSTRSVRRKLEKYLALAGLSPDLSPSTLRHSYAMHLVEQGANARQVCELLGHRNLSSSKNYSRVASSKRDGNRNSPTERVRPARDAVAA
jgi:integrase/recombinase XerC